MCFQLASLDSLDRDSVRCDNVAMSAEYFSLPSKWLHLSFVDVDTNIIGALDKLELEWHMAMTSFIEMIRPIVCHAWYYPRRRYARQNGGCLNE